MFDLDHGFFYAHPEHGNGFYGIGFLCLEVRAERRTATTFRIRCLKSRVARPLSSAFPVKCKSISPKGVSVLVLCYCMWRTVFGALTSCGIWNNKQQQQRQRQRQHYILMDTSKRQPATAANGNYRNHADPFRSGRRVCLCARFVPGSAAAHKSTSHRLSSVLGLMSLPLRLLCVARLGLNLAFLWCLSVTLSP